MEYKILERIQLSKAQSIWPYSLYEYREIESIAMDNELRVGDKIRGKRIIRIDYKPEGPEVIVEK